MRNFFNIISLIYKNFIIIVPYELLKIILNSIKFNNAKYIRKYKPN